MIDVLCPVVIGRETELRTVVPKSCRELWVLMRSGGDWKIAHYMHQEVDPE